VRSESTARARKWASPAHKEALLAEGQPGSDLLAVLRHGGIDVDEMTQLRVLFTLTAVLHRQRASLWHYPGPRLADRVLLVRYAGLGDGVGLYNGYEGPPKRRFKKHRLVARGVDRKDPC
jgi:hypothetical protein